MWYGVGLWPMMCHLISCACITPLPVVICPPSAYKAIHGVIHIIKTFAENEDTLPLNVAMEFRFTQHSDSLLSPAYGQQVQ